ncbi:MAG TPA: diaminopimelate epimerase [bacterium]|nr:diaminopimelate epimerase [bacterium]
MTPPRSKMPFAKMEGCGNDYIYIDGIANRFPMERGGELARAWSDRHFGIGADGLIVLGRAADGDDGCLRMSMWNADGSRGAMCGNGLRCLARFAADAGYVRGREVRIATDAGPRAAELLVGDLVRVDMGTVSCGEARELEVAGEPWTFVPGDAGNPHVVTFVDEVDTAPVERVGAAMQSHPAFADGVNVEFVQVLGADRFRQRTFERGSGETLACGTGAAVAALAARRSGNIRGPVAHVELRGGNLAVVGIGPALAIEGPARTVYRGEIELA